MIRLIDNHATFCESPSGLINDFGESQVVWCANDGENYIPVNGQMTRIFILLYCKLRLSLAW